MQPGPLLAGAGLDPPTVATVVGIADLDSLDVRPAPVWLRRMWRQPVAAMTLLRRIYVTPEVLTGDPVRLGRLLVHELVHARQWQQAGPIRFVCRYVLDYVRSRLSGSDRESAYRQIRYEIEARRIAGT